MMEFTIERDALHNALQFVGRRAKVQAGAPLMSHVLMVCAEGGAGFIGHDLSASSEAECAAEAAVPGTCAAPAESLGRLVGGFPQGAHVKFKLNGPQLEVACGRSRYKLPALPPDDFPAALDPSETVPCELDMAEISKLFAGPRPAVCTDGRVEYQGMFLHASGGKLACAATDGHRLLRFCVAIQAPAAPSVIIPTVACEEIARLAAFGSAMFSWSASVLQATWPEAGLRFSTKLIDAKFPPYEKFPFPAADGPCIECSRAELMAVLARLAAFEDARPTAAFTWGDEPSEVGLRLWGQDKGEGDEVIACQGAGLKAGTISAPPGQLLDLLGAMSADTVKIFSTDPTKPFRLVDPSDPDMLAIQVPVSGARAVRRAA